MLNSSKESFDKSKSADSNEIVSDRSNLELNSDVTKRPSIWKELESMGELPPENNEHYRKNVKKNRRRDERNEFPKVSYEASPSQMGDYSRRKSGGGRREFYDDRQYQGPENYADNKISRNSNWSREEHGHSLSKDGKIAKNSPAFRSMQVALSGYGRGRTNSRNNQGANDNIQSGRGRGDGTFTKIEERWGHDDFQTNRDDCNDDDNSDDDAYNKSTRGADSPTFELIKQAFQTLDRSTRSSKNITNLILTTMEKYINDSQKWQKLISDYLLGYACEQGGVYIELASQLFVRFIDEPTFQKAAYIVLMKNIGQLMTPHEWSKEESRYLSNLCEFFGKLLISTWPPGWDSCAKECNMIVYAVMNAVHTWLRALEKLQATNKKAPSKVEVTEICAMSLVSLATATGRKLWLKWPDLVDQMYSTLKPVIVSNECGLCEETKSHLLDLFVKLNEWPKPVSQSYHRATTRDVFCQTEDDVFTFNQWQNNLPNALGTSFYSPQGNSVNDIINGSNSFRSINPRNILIGPFKQQLPS